MRKELIVIIIILFVISAKGQQFEKIYSENFKSLNVGDTVPETLWRSIPKGNRAKLVILDFWSTYCGTCIEAFPKMEKLQYYFRGDIQIVLINTTETDSVVKQRFSQTNRKRDRSKWLGTPASLPALNGRIEFHTLFPYTTVPHHVWLNSDGKVLSITNGYNATIENIEKCIKQNKVSLIQKNDVLANEVVQNNLIQPAIPIMPPVYYSAFMSFFQASENLKLKIDSAKSVFKLSLYNYDVTSHFKIAFEPGFSNIPFEKLKYAFGNSEKRIRTLLELRDEDRFQPPIDLNLMDDWKHRNLFTYELQGMIQNSNDWQTYMQQDINRFFGGIFGIEGKVETRKFTCLVLKRINESALVSTGGILENSIQEHGAVWRNEKFRNIMNFFYRFENMKLGRPLLDETGITYPVDLKLVGDLTSLKNIKEQLLQYGLDITEEERAVEVLVIKDKKRF